MNFQINKILRNVVSTWFEISVAPQNKKPYFVRATCHGHELGMAIEPPTIFKLDSFGFTAWMPHESVIEALNENWTMPLFIRDTHWDVVVT